MKSCKLVLASLFIFTCGNALMAQNPYTPLWEHMPDGEPRVFEDPDNPGKYRIYVIGSHDTRFTSFCGQDDREWSASIDDLSQWRDDGPVFSYKIDGKWDGMYAPDLVEVNPRNGKRQYYLYPHSRGEGRLPMVCVGDRPDGPFTPVNMTEDGLGVLEGSVMDFDPGVLIESVDDPSDPDYQIGYRAYGAWGIACSGATELDQATMYSPRHGQPDYPLWMPSQLMLMLKNSGLDNLSPQAIEGLRMMGVNLDNQSEVNFPAIAEGEDFNDFAFFEASSFRQVGNKYVFIYSGYSGEEYGISLSNATLRYAYADHPNGPWKSGGVLVDARGPVLSRDGQSIQDSFSGNNTHGSLAQINRQWYVFYHRSPRGFANARQAMVAPVYVDVDPRPIEEGGYVKINAYDPYVGGFTVKAKDGNEYKGAEVTSEGFQIFGLDPYKYYSAGYACYMSDPSTMQDSWDIWDNRMDIVDVKSGDILGYKYFGFGGLKKATKGLKPFSGTRRRFKTSFNLFLASKTDESFKVGIWIDSPWNENGTKVGEIVVPQKASREVTRYTVKLGKAVDKLKKKHALYLVVEGSSDGSVLCDIVGLGFSKKKETMTFNQVPQINLFADGSQINTPQFPIRASDENGIMGYDLYETFSAGEITATCDNKDVDISISHEGEDTFVKCTYNGIAKTYIVHSCDSSNGDYSSIN